MSYQTFHAKSTNRQNYQTLRSHCLAVAHTSKYIMRDVFHVENPAYVESAFYAGLFHDIGKALPYTQGYFESTKEEHSEENKTFSGVFHQEASWAVAQCLDFPGFPHLLCKDNSFEGRDILDAVSYAIYWHHSQPVYYDEGERKPCRGDSCDVVSDEELVYLLEEMVNPLTEESNLGTLSSRRDMPSVKTPLLHGIPVPTGMCTFKVKSHIGDLVRSALISADRLVSSLFSEDDVDFQKLVSGEIPSILVDAFSLQSSTPCCSVERPSLFDADRWDIQSKCLGNFSKWEKPVAIINAPAGFGKTSLGLRSKLLSGNQTFWVCPRNMVVESVARSLKEESSLLGVDISIEVVLGSRRKEELCHNMDGVSETLFSGDIVVTNIDNLMKATVNNEWATNLWKIYSADMIFDEFHEFPEVGGLFALFIQTMQIRAGLIRGSRTLLLSATPHDVPLELWDPMGRNTLSLPERFQHYPAAHAVPYTFKLQDSVPETLPPGCLFKTNAILTCQKYYEDKGSTHIIHSSFFEEDRKVLTDFLFQEFGKGGSREKTLTAPPIVNASLNVSFVNVYAIASSAAHDTQLLGRCNRFGDIRGSEFVLLTGDLSRSEMAALSNKGLLDKSTTGVSISVRDLWMKFIQEKMCSPTTMSLDDYYREVYNDFCKKYAPQILAHASATLKGRSLSILPKVYPHKMSVSPTSRRGRGSRKAPTGGNLRSPDPSFYVAVRDPQGQFLTETLSLESWEIDALIDDFSNQYTAEYFRSKTLPVLASAFPLWGEQKKTLKRWPAGKTLRDFLKVLAREEETPFPCPEDWFYAKVTDPVAREEGLLGPGLKKK